MSLKMNETERWGQSLSLLRLLIIDFKLYI